MAKTIIKKNEENPETVEVIAKSIIDIAEAMQRIENTPLNRRALVVLIKDQTGLPQRDINLVLNSITDLKKDFIKPLKK